MVRSLTPAAGALLMALGLAAGLLAEDRPQQSILETASTAGSFQTLVKAIKAAELGDVLDGPGPFTVFAPTDTAFAAVPQEKLDALLSDPKQLAAVLTYHVVPGEVLAKDVVKLKTAKTAQGASVKIAVEGEAVRINDAQVVKTDIRCANGVIHVIDAVLLPPADVKPAAKRAREALEESEKLEDPADQVRLLETAVGEARDLAKSNVLVQESLSEALEQAGRLADHEPKLIALREALREAVGTLEFKPFQEAKLPAGFPEPTPIGEIRVKEYPAYRMARTSLHKGRAAEGRAFFTLFEHIVRNRIEMTAPVELTYAGDQELPRGEAMAFLYENASLGQVGAENGVEVVDVPSMMTVSIGVQGDHNAESIAEAEGKLRRWLSEHDEYRATGKLRVMGYNSPMVPVERRYLEVELPIEPVGKSEPQGG